MNLRYLVGALFALLLLASTVHATELGVNYYHESLMNPWSDGPYIKRSLSEVGQDFDNIKQISNSVKLYMNPFIDENLQWNEQVAAVGKQKGMRVVINMMVDDRQLTDANWDDYANRVVASCSALSGKVDEVLVGNEITLHSPMARTDIRDRVIALMDRCKQVFPGDVSYEEFWYAKDVWKGYSGRLYWMQYESLDAFRVNVQEMDASWGDSAMIGEWGEDLLEDKVEYDETWQAEQIRQRWEIIKQSGTPIAYIFTYREPSWNAFGLMRPDGTPRPQIWEFFKASGGSVPVAQPAPPVQAAPDPAPVVESQPVQQPVEPAPTMPSSAEPQAPIAPTEQAIVPPTAPVEQTVQQSTSGPAVPTQTPMASLNLLRLPLTCAAEDHCIAVSDTTTGACREVTFDAAGTQIKVLGCDKGDGYIEVYLQEPIRAPFAACLGNACVSNANGYIRIRDTLNTQ